MPANWELIHPDYQLNYWQWRYTELAYLGGHAWRTPDIASKWSRPVEAPDQNLVTSTSEVYSFLRRHAREEAYDYYNRQNNAYYRNFVRPVVDIRAAHVLGKPIERSAATTAVLDAVWEDVDMRGNDITSFMAEGLVSAQLFGHVFAVVDMPRVMPEEVRSLADAQAAALRPFVTWYSPLAVADWEVDGFGRFTAIKLAEADNRASRTSLGDEPAPARIMWRCWYPDRWELREGPKGDSAYNAEGRAEAGKIIEEGLNPLGRVPVEVMYYHRQAGSSSPCGWTDVYDIATANGEIYNLDSQRQDMTQNQAFAFLCVPDKSGQVTRVDVGIRRAFVYEPDAGMPSYVGPPTEYVTLNREEVADHILQIRALSGMSRGQGEASVAARAASALLVETADKSAVLLGMARQAEDFEQRLAEMVANWVGTSFDGTVQYASDYSARGLMDDIDEAIKILDVDIGPVGASKVKEGIIRKAMPGLPADDITAMVQSMLDKPPPPPSVTLVTPTDIARIVLVNEARGQVGLGPLTLPNGAPSPDGQLTVSELGAKIEAKLAQEQEAAKAGIVVKAGEPQPSTPPPKFAKEPDTTEDK